MQSAVNQPAGVLSKFLSGGSENLARYRSTAYDELVMQMAEVATLEEMVDCAARAEDMLINDAVIIPLYLSTTYFGTGADVRGVEYSPYSGRVLFRNATK